MRARPSTLRDVVMGLCIFVITGALLLGVGALITWLYVTPMLSASLKIAIGAGVVATLAGAIAKVLHSL